MITNRFHGVLKEKLAPLGLPHPKAVKDYGINGLSLWWYPDEKTRYIQHIIVRLSRYGNRYGNLEDWTYSVKGTPYRTNPERARKLLREWGL